MHHFVRRPLQRQQFIGPQIPLVVGSGRTRENRLTPFLAHLSRTSHFTGRSYCVRSSTRVGATAWRGSRRLARQPVRSSRFSSIRLPPWASAICRLRTRPIPDPPGLVVKNGTNRLPVFDNPGPSSSTHSSIAGGVAP